MIDPTAQIHPSAVIADGARIGPGVRIGPFCVIGPHVQLGPRVVLHSHVVVEGHTEIGEDTEVWPFAALGCPPQHLRYAGEPTRLVIGRRNRIRETVTMHTGTEHGGGITRVGDDGMFMAGSHVSHDSIVGNRVIMANQAALGGHCVIGDDVIIGGLSGIHQFVRVGSGAMIGAVTMVTADVAPNGLVAGPRGRLEGLNLVGLKRRGVSREEIRALRRAFRAIFNGERPLMENARAHAAAGEHGPKVAELLAFLLGDTERSFLTPRS